MKINIIASTKVGFALPKEEAVNFSGKLAGICYLPDTVEKLFAEPEEKTRKRAIYNIKSGHHSVFGHATYSLSFEGIPKILAMLLNNEKMYNTSEKSARYTLMSTSSRETELYEKWIRIFKEQILLTYPNFDEKKAQKLSQENARYLISIFTPATVMEYTVNFGQWNYIVNWANDYIEKIENDKFSSKLKAVLEEFLGAIPNLKVEGLDSKIKNRSFSLFAQRKIRNEEFGENYSTNYLASFAQLAQAQRHRTLSYEMTLLDEDQYYIPPIIKSTALEGEWLRDISSLKEDFPQGMLIHVNERGTIENFILKCTERLCGASQLEIMEQTQKTMAKYLNATKNQPDLYNYLLPYSKGARCTFPGWICTSPCVFGSKGATHRII
ncbi:MAG: FAD-dependent thymidylate synthase [Bacilli bacterium]|nr:FAD-dependent thymidylate synthase [Bacilli bacterium]